MNANRLATIGVIAIEVATTVRKAADDGWLQQPVIGC